MHPGGAEAHGSSSREHAILIKRGTELIGLFGMRKNPVPAFLGFSGYSRRLGKRGESSAKANSDPLSEVRYPAGAKPLCIDESAESGRSCIR